MSKFGNKRKVIQSRELDLPEVENSYEYEENPLLRKIIVYGTVALVAVLFALYLSKRDTIQQNRQDRISQLQATQETQRDLGEAYVQFKIQDKKGDEAFAKGDYMQAIFQYRQALTYGATSTETYKKLIQALEKSCEQGEEAHCNAIDPLKQRMANLEAGTESDQ